MSAWLHVLGVGYVSISAQIIKRHRGSVEAHAAESVGSVFIVRLPLLHSEHAAREHLGSVPERRRNGSDEEARIHRAQLEQEWDVRMRRNMQDPPDEKRESE
jgi:hypothetical protein